MHLAMIGLSLLWILSLEAAPISFKNDREGQSFYDSPSLRKAHIRAIKSIRSEDIIRSFTEVVSLSREDKLCSYTINEEFYSRLKGLNPSFRDFKGALYHLRFKNEIDDTIFKILARAYEVESTNLYLPKIQESLFSPTNKTKLSEMIEVMEEIPERLERGCLEEVYKSLYGGLVKIDKKIKSYHIEALLVKAFQVGVINFREYSALEKARVNRLERAPLDLKSYYRKVKRIRARFPLRDPAEQSAFATEKYDRKMSRRQRLFEQYSELQIMLMGDVINKLRARLDSDKVEILVYSDPSTVKEVIPLEPLERFRFAIKLLRKEMMNLSLSQNFKGVSPSYMDIMTAAYETGIVPASELDEVVGLQDLWNPQKTFWEKALNWGRSFGSVASVIIPPPYGFLPALALVVIELTSSSKTQAENPGSLF